VLMQYFRYFRHLHDDHATMPVPVDQAFSGS
jgi:hypothetical protein